MTFNEALTEDDYNSFENVFAVIQLRSTDPEWLKDNEDCMLVRPLAKVKMHPDGSLSSPNIEDSISAAE